MRCIFLYKAELVTNQELISSCQCKSEIPLLLEHVARNKEAGVDRQVDFLCGATEPLPIAGGSALRDFRDFWLVKSHLTQTELLNSPHKLSTYGLNVPLPQLLFHTFFLFFFIPAFSFLFKIVQPPSLLTVHCGKEAEQGFEAAVYSGVGTL